MMLHRFVLEYELDCPVVVAVAAYLDAEHYAFLHRKYQTEYRVIGVVGTGSIAIHEGWTFLGIRRSGACITRYLPPATFYNLSGIRRVMTTETWLRYTPAPGNRTISTLEVTLRMAWWLYPFRRLIQRALERLKIEKDAEDLAMIHRRARLFGRGNIAAYLKPDQFLLHKQAFREAFNL